MAIIRKLALLMTLIFSLSFGAFCQQQSTVQEGELGISLGAAHYFGDLNPKLRLNRPKVAFGIFAKKQYGDYVGVRLSGHFAQLGYSDIYNSYNEFMHTRNLSFQTNIWEFTLQGDFNFFKYIPGDLYKRYTPYITLGAGIFNYDPYAYYQGQKVYLRPLGTEGQGSAAYPNRKTYSTLAVCFPIGVGYKYSINSKVNVGFEIVYRFTTTDYIDDVSTTYAGPAAFPALPNGQPSLAGILQDRSYVYGTPIGVAGRQRGYSNQKDSYVMAELMLSINLTSYKCPTAKP
ncbi:MAG TPA: DUF6089 family protein [Puia sp.]|nr:DUF6089 family protein [Puia sp.]